MTTFAFVLLLLCLSTSTLKTECSSLPSLVVKTPNGDLRGTRTFVKHVQRDKRGELEDCDGVFIDKFLGIPYAEAPIGTSRFKSPQPPGKWEGVRDATQAGAQCYQKHCVLPGLLPDSRFNNSEDCLLLNVFTPRVCLKGTDESMGSNQPVMMFIHGGGNFLGTGNTYDASQLAARGVVVVTINYRLGALGFLSTEDSVSLGNYGLLDQIQALQWIRDAIACFNGNPRDVTVFGESTGSGSVSILTLSPAAKGLFTKAIMQSGVSMYPLTLSYPPAPRSATRRLATRLGCWGGDSAYTVNCLRSRHPQDIIDASFELQLTFSPVAESSFCEKGVLTTSPAAILTNGDYNDVITIKGFNSEESATTVYDPEDDGLTLSELRYLAGQFLQDNLPPMPFAELDMIHRLVMNAYVHLPNVTDPKGLREAAIKMQTDFIFIAPIVKELQLMTSQSAKPQYLYRFSHRSANRLNPRWQGVVHADELQYVFGAPLSDDLSVTGFVSNWTDDDKRVSNDVITMWTNFAKYGNPTPFDQSESPGVAWLPWTQATPRFIDLTRPAHMSKGPIRYQLSLWIDTVFNMLSMAEEGPVVALRESAVCSSCFRAWDFD